MIVQELSVSTATRVGSIRNIEDCREAARLIKAGYPVGAFVRSTCGIFVDAANPQGVGAVYTIKGAKRAGRPLSVLLYARALVPLLDLGRIRPDLRSIFGNPAELASRLATLCFMRLPITESAARLLPPVVVSETPDGAHWLQNYVPGEWGPAFPLVDEMLAAGITLPSGTSMNVSGLPEIVDQDEALAFCAAHGIPLFLADPGAKPAAEGSYPIISVGPEGVKLVREGHFPGNLFDFLLETTVNTLQAAPARFPVYRTHCERCASSMAPHELHDEIVAILEGADLP